MAKPTTRDFAKRPKAKVGKKAPKKINATDTSFKTASVAVKSQGQGLDKNKVSGKDEKQTSTLSSAASRLELASSRGNTLSTLQLSLRHHAPAVRVSGLKGIRDAVQSLSALDDSALGISILEANLPTLLPNMCRCWLDEDDDARGLAINLFGDILKNLCGGTSSSEQSDLMSLSPFVPFLCAYASSALNSLDRDIRKDGAKIVGMLSSSKPILSFSLLSTNSEDEGGGLSAMSIEMGSHVDLFIPSLERLLSSMSLGGRRGNNNTSSKDGTKKRKRDGNSNISSAQTSSSVGVVSMAASDATILSLGLLLQASLASTENVRSSSNANITTSKRRLNSSLLVCGESTFLKGGSTHANAMLLFREGVKGNNNKQTAIQSIWDLPSMSVDDLVGSRENMYTSDESVVPQQQAGSIAGTDTSTMEKIQSLDTLLETLRMKFVELTHSGRAHEKGGLIMPTTDLDTMDILIQTIRLTHQQCQEYLKLVDEKELSLLTHMNARTTPAPRKSTKSKKKSKTKDVGECLATYKATVDKALTLLLESFPIMPMDNKLSRYELTNAGICNTLAEFGGDSRESSHQWISSVFAYILPRLQTSSAPIDNNNVATKDNASEKIATNMLLKVVSKLLLSHSAHTDTGESSQTYLLKDLTKRRELLEAFASTFFVESEQVKQLAPTPMGRTAAMLLTSLVPQLVTDSADMNDKCFVLRMMSVLPVYLVAWEGNYPIQTGLVLSSITSVVRQWNENHVPEDEIPINNLCLELRSKLKGLYITSKKKPSIFERLPEQVQKLCVGLIGLLKCPPGDLMKSLASICALKDSESNARISDIMSNYIMEVVHSLRKTIPMPTYITFLIDSCGIKRASSTLLQNLSEDTGSSPLIEAVFSYDSAIGQLCRFLTTSCDGASLKVLPMIRPVLQKWMENPSCSTPNDIFKQLVQARASISILAAFTWDEVLSQGHIESNKFVGPVFLKLDDEFDSQLIECIVSQFELSARIWSMEGGDYMDDLEIQQQYLAKLLGPITLLLRYRKGMFDQFIKAITYRVTQQKETLVEETGKEDVSSSKQINVIEVLMKTLLLVLKSKEPVSIVELVRDNKELQSTLLDAAEQMEKAVSGGHLSHLGNKIRHTVKLIQQ